MRSLGEPSQKTEFSVIVDHRESPGKKSCLSPQWDKWLIFLQDKYLWEWSHVKKVSKYEAVVTEREDVARGVYPCCLSPRFLPIAGPLCVLSLDLVYWRSSVRCPRECGEGSLVPGVGSKREMPALVLPGVELTPPDPAFFILNTTLSRGMRVILHLGCNQWAYCFRVAAGTLSSLARKTILGIQVNESVQLPPLFSTERIVCWYLGLYYYVSFT